MLSSWEPGPGFRVPEEADVVPPAAEPALVLVVEAVEEEEDVAEVAAGA